MKIRTNALAGIALAATAALGLAACGSGTSRHLHRRQQRRRRRHSRRRDHGLQRPARDPDQGVGGRLHRGNRHQGHPAPGRRHRDVQPDRPGRPGLTGGRLPHRELPRHGPGGKRRPLRGRGQGHRGPGPRRVPPLHQQVDRHRRPLHRAGLRQEQDQRGQAAQVHAGPGQPRVEGQVGRLAVGRRLPGDRLGPARTQGRSRHRRSGSRA